MSESKQQNRGPGVRLTTAGSTPPGYPHAGPVPPEDLTLLAPGAITLKPLAEPAIPFVFEVEYGGAAISDLRTSGFDDTDLPELNDRNIVQTPELAAPVDTSRTPLNTTSPRVDSVYEPMEFLDFDEPETESAFAFEPQSEPEPLPPPMAMDPISVPLRFASPGQAKLMQGVSDIPMPPLSVELTDVPLRTLRRRIAKGPNPNKPAAKLEPPVPAPAGVALPAAAKQASPQMVVRPAQSVKPQVKPAAPAQQRPAAAKAAPEQPKQQPPAPVETKPVPAQEKPKVATRPAEPSRSTPSTAPKPAIAARDRGNAVTVRREDDLEPASAPAPKPKLMPIRKPDPQVPAPAASEPVPMIGLSTPGVAEGMSPVMKAAIAVIAVIGIGGGGYFAFSGNSGKASASSPSEIVSDITAPGMVMGGGGWTTTWGSNSPNNEGKQISIYRPSMAMTDYRFEFRGHIERKALGWVFRAADPKNYYVMKLEMIKPGANPLVALIKYAVINGKETTRTQIMLPFDVALDTVYQVRIDVKGDKFSTYVQNKLVDYWTDDRIKVGGTGFYNDKGERAQIKSSQVSYLTAGK